MPIQTVEQAEAIQNKLAIRIDQLEREIDDASKTSAADYAALAEGADVQADTLANLQAQLQILREAYAAAELGTSRARQLEVGRLIVNRTDEAHSLLSQREEWGREVSDALDVVADLLLKLDQNSHRLVPAIRRGRGAETATPAGFVVFDPTVLRIDHLQRLVNIHLMKRVRGWRYDEAPPHLFTFAEGTSGANGELRQEINLLLDALPAEDLAAIRAEQTLSIPEEA